MYTSKYWWEVISIAEDYVRFRYRGHYIQVPYHKIAVSDIRLGYLGQIISGGGYAFMSVFPPDWDCIKLKNPLELVYDAHNRWRKLMGR